MPLTATTPRPTPPPGGPAATPPAATGLASATTVWNCAESATPANIFKLSISIKDNAITIKGTDAYDGRAGGVAFSMTGKILREYDSSRCDFKVVGSSATVREARGYIDGDQINFVIKSKSPPAAATANQWLEKSAIGFKAP